MDILSRLPLELILLVVEQACITSGRTDWIASLCLVSKSVQSVATTILYECVHIHHGNIGRLTALSCDDPRQRLALVHELFIDFNPVYKWSHVGALTHDDACAFDDTYSSLWRALTGVRVLSGTSGIIEDIAHRNPHIRQQLKSLFIRDRVLWWNQFELLPRRRCMKSLMHSVTHLHIVLHVIYPKTPFLGDDVQIAVLRETTSVVQFVVVDIWYGDLWFERRPDVAEHIEEIRTTLPIVFPNFQRLVLRLRGTSEKSALVLREAYTAWAVETRDGRIFLDESNIFDKRFNAKVDMGMARKGYALWDRGQQLWRG
ncbi:hypothetical protein EXIGLDRAFT_333212 [Exidia glandulosa HHB12029]|uniref:F-box domain-containing protein n=1 Tax=Exidia glandulosa HHB12029 TaxID=1314781 RepID=A0A165LMG2_EXIGL|nr:hypothetical protein EXIGLDRAFT_333212 [Exidia glandulosa HHB12029]